MTAGHKHDAHQAPAPSSLGRLATATTAHCLAGCGIGEWCGLAIGVLLQLGTWPTIALATVLGFAGGYALGLLPLVRQGTGWTKAFRMIWLGETVSIAVMELAMNVTDYHLGGIQVSSLLAPRFWLGFAAALPAGFVASWPVNYWLLKRNIKRHVH
ncbi:MAG: DUF4396 domain-containing protein [Gemmatimonadota bacterium]